MTFDKDKYWENRKAGRNGTYVEPTKVKKVEQDEIPKGATLSFDNDGNMVIKNRAYRRQRVRLYPKSSQLRKKNKRK